MHETLRGARGDRLERSCERFRTGSDAPGLERAEVVLGSEGYAPHRHDSYALGVTLAGVQRFRYRGAQRTCLPGQLHVLHPDEEHDGAAGTPAGLRYRILYLDPALVHAALDGGLLPFVREPVQRDPRAVRAIAGLLEDLDDPVSDLALHEVAATVADVLRGLAGSRPRQEPIARAAVERVREHLAARPQEQTPATALEAIAGLDRYTLARHFRRAYGTSPDRYRTLRRLDRARAAIRAGRSLAEVAAETGFADQSHLTRQFQRAYGLTPGRWARLSR